MINSEGYTFKILKSRNIHRPYKVMCCENRIEKESALSIQDAINLIIAEINFAKGISRRNNLDKEYVKSAFDILKGKTMSDINNIVEEEVSIGKGIQNIDTQRREEFALEQVYLTPKFKIVVSRQNVRSRINKVEVEDIINAH